MTPFFYALYLFCGLAAATFAAAIRSKVQAGVALLAFALAAWANIPDPVVIGTAGGAIAILILLRPRFAVLGPLLAGALAGVLVPALRAQAMPIPVAVLAALAIPISAAYLSYRSPAFASPAIREEALLLIGLFGLITGMAPGVAAGWNSAGGMNLADNKVLPPAMPAWVFALGGGSTLLGGLFAIWRRN